MTRELLDDMLDDDDGDDFAYQENEMKREIEKYQDELKLELSEKLPDSKYSEFDDLVKQFNKLKSKKDME